MKIRYKTIARATGDCGVVTLDTENLRIFSYETEKEQVFYDSLTKDEWTKVPEKYQGEIVNKNFICFCRLPGGNENEENN